MCNTQLALVLALIPFLKFLTYVRLPFSPCKVASQVACADLFLYLTFIVPPAPLSSKCALFHGYMQQYINNEWCADIYYLVILRTPGRAIA